MADLLLRKDPAGHGDGEHAGEAGRHARERAAEDAGHHRTHGQRGLQRPHLYSALKSGYPNTGPLGPVLFFQEVT